ncbi:MAG: PD-(D/E)XK nuclease family protein [Clostridia bacterium]|nr:PD-(D/E)XK nuclease family protein [Clostridia bacterium]
MRIYTGRSHLLAPAMTETLRRAMDSDAEAYIVVVPKQLTLQTERTLLKSLGLQGSFKLQVYSPERLCARIFDAAGQPEGVRIDERGRVMLVRRAVEACVERLTLYRTANSRRGFADKCARQLELIRQAGLTPEALIAAGEDAEGMLSMKLTDLALILEEYEKLIEGRFQDGESEFICAAHQAEDASFLRNADVRFFGFDLTPPTLLDLMAAVGAVCPRTSIFLPLENNGQARDFDVFLPLQASFERLWHSAKLAGVQAERIRIEPGAGFDEAGDRLFVPAPPQHPELARLEKELFAFPAEPDASGKPPKHIQLATLRNPLEECRFAAALCRRMAMKRGLRWNEMLIICPDIEAYRQPMREAFRAYNVPLFLSSSRAAGRHALAECLMSALRMIDSAPRSEDALSLMRTGYMPITPDEADRLANYSIKHGLRPRNFLSPLRRGTQAELSELEPIREKFAAPLSDLRTRLKNASTLTGQLSAVFGFLTDIDAAGRLQSHMNRLSEAGLREQAGEESQVWNRIIGALDQMAALMGEKKLPLKELREILTESLEAAVIKPLPQSDDAVYAQTSERIVAQRTKVLLVLGMTDRSGSDEDGLLSSAQRQALSRATHTYVGGDDGELSRMRRFYLKSAMGMASDYLCITWPMSGMDDSAQHPGALIGLVRNIFPHLSMRGGVTEDDSVQRMLRCAPEAARSYAAGALSEISGDTPLKSYDAAALAGLRKLSEDRPLLRDALDCMGTALDRGKSAEQINPRTARELYGAIRRQSVTRLEKYAQCPFAYFTQYGLRPERIEPFGLTARDEGTFFHDAVHEFMLGSMEDLNRIGIAEAEARMDAISDRLLDAMQSGPLGNSAVEAAERRRLKATARTCAGVLAEHMKESQFAPSALESDFGTEDGVARLTVNAATGECILEGRIDRIDTWAEGGYLRVIDYKRGGKAPELDGVYHGLSLQLPVYLAAAMKKQRKNSAGVYYFNLDEGIIALQSTDKYEVEKKRLSQFRLNGVAPDNPELLNAMSPNFGEVLNVRANKDGSLAKGTLATDENGFRAIIDRALEMAGRHLDGIRGGNAAISPAAFRQRTPCAYCDWHSICLFDSRMDAGCVRRFKTMRGDAVIEKLKLAQEPDEDKTE